MATTDDEWKEKLTSEQYKILRQKGTEAPFTGALLHNDATGDYTCAACGNLIFKSNTKFDSGSGWPSFYDVADTKAIKMKEDTSVGMFRTEVECANCGGHLGHLFHDAPDQPTGNRFCVNSASLAFKPHP
ncbi:MAG: peptide-methionine (R)-S-oxide reductase MsrB [Candidatus Saccharimonadales bacterium]